MGAITNQLLRQRELLEPIESTGNWVQQAPQGDFLVNAMRTGALDAAIVYASNAAMARDHIEIIPFDSDGYLARQPWAIARSSTQARTLERLLDALQAEQSARRFRELGFVWLADQPGTTQEPRTP